MTTQIFEIGRFELKYQYRDVGTDSGPALHLFGPRGSAREEVLRFDCFQKEPHYHIGFSYREVPFIRIESAEPLQWAVEKLRNNVNELLTEADAEPMNSKETARLCDVLDELGSA